MILGNNCKNVGEIIYSKHPCIPAALPCMKSKAMKRTAWRFTVDAHKPQEHAVWRTAVLRNEQESRESVLSGAC